MHTSSQQALARRHKEWIGIGKKLLLYTGCPEHFRAGSRRRDPEQHTEHAQPSSADLH